MTVFRLKCFKFFLQVSHFLAVFRMTDRFHFAK